MLYQLDAKLTINNIPKGKGTLELTQALNKNLTLLIFRNCIKSVLFTGALYAESIIKIKDTPCKVKNHTEKKDIEISLIQQPEGKKIECFICISSISVDEFKNHFDKSLEYIKE